MDIRVEKVNETWIRVNCEPGIRMELSDFFSFYAENYRFMPKYKSGMWDGKIRLLNSMTGMIYAGLAYRIVDFARERDYTIQLPSELEHPTEYVDVGNQFAEEFNGIYVPRNHQNLAVTHCVNHKRCVLLAPTGSGKSYIIYLLSRFHESEGRKVLIIVPTLNLLYQMETDFIDYNHGKALPIHKIQSGADKDTDCPYVISTWQSIQRMPKQWFSQFDAVFGDEAHLYEAKSLTKILENSTNIEYRVGLTGSLKDTKTNKLTLEGIFGPVQKFVSTKDLIDQGELAKMAINGLVFEYSSAECKHVSGMTYQEEMDWIVTHEKRNAYIAKLTEALDGNVLILFQYIDKQGHLLKPMLEASTTRKFHYVDGSVDGAMREQIRKEVDSSDRNTLLASYGTFSTGSNIKRLHHIVLASPFKSRIRSLQSIGRGLRLHETKEKLQIYDLADNLKWKSNVNHTALHFYERVKIYREEQFPLKIISVNLTKEKK